MPMFRRSDLETARKERAAAEARAVLEQMYAYFDFEQMPALSRGSQDAAA